MLPQPLPSQPQLVRFELPTTVPFYPPSALCVACLASATGFVECSPLLSAASGFCICAWTFSACVVSCLSHVRLSSGPLTALRTVALSVRTHWKRSAVRLPAFFSCYRNGLVLFIKRTVSLCRRRFQSILIVRALLFGVATSVPDFGNCQVYTQSSGRRASTAIAGMVPQASEYSICTVCGPSFIYAVFHAAKGYS